MNNPKIGEYVGNCGGSGNPRVVDIRSDSQVLVKIDTLQPVWCEVQRSANPIPNYFGPAPLMAVKLVP